MSEGKFDVVLQFGQLDMSTGFASKYLDNEPLISYLISNKRLDKGDDPEYEALLENCSDILFESEQDVFSNFDEITNMIKETHKNVLNGLKMMAEKILKNYE